MVVTNQINALDPNSLADLKRLARDNSPQAVRGAARQFEALFLQMVLKSMRDATPTDGLMDNEQTRMFQGLLDQQMATNMAQSRGVGLADLLVRQLGGGAAFTPGTAGVGQGSGTTGDLAGVIRQPANAAAVQSLPELAAGLAARRAAARAAEAQAGAASGPGTAAMRSANAAVASDTPNDFVDRVWPHAVAVSRETGIPARFLVAQAALETGWGRGELRHPDGSPSFNLFNIKAGKS